MTLAVVTAGTCRPADLVRLTPGSLVLMDCEGAEIRLLTEEVAASNSQTRFIIECHDFVESRILSTLQTRFTGRRIEGGTRGAPRSARDGW